MRTEAVWLLFSLALLTASCELYESPAPHEPRAVVVYRNDGSSPAWDIDRWRAEQRAERAAAAADRHAPRRRAAPIYEYDPAPPPDVAPDPEPAPINLGGGVDWDATYAAHDVKIQCIEANEKAQDRRLAGDLDAAYRLFTLCNKPICPQAVRDDCAQEIEEMAR